MSAGEALLASAGAIATVATSFLVARYGYRASTHATDTTAALQEEANAVDGYHKLAADLRIDMDRLRKEFDQLRRDFDAAKQQIRGMEAERRKDRSKIRQLVAWVLVMRDALRDAHVPIPDPPGGGDPDDLLALP